VTALWRCTQLCEVRISATGFPSPSGIDELMKILLVAPIDETVPPVAYGGIEQVVHLLDHDLTARGHNVTLLASSGSVAASRLIPITDEPIERPHNDREAEYVTAIKHQAVQRVATVLADERPDIVLNHSWRVLDTLTSYSSLTTVHFPLDTEPYRSIFLTKKHAAYISISNAQKRDALNLLFVATIYNGIDVAAMPYSGQQGDYLAFLGRVSPEKGLDIAIRTAQRIGIPLRIAAKLDHVHVPWFHDVILPLAQRGGVEFVGEITASQKGPFLSRAIALLHPSRCNEPFGLAVVEAMACGTPVVALNRGAAIEIIQHGYTGFVVDNEAGIWTAIKNLHKIERSACREHAASRFDRHRMAEEYEKFALAHLAKQ